MVSSQPAYEFTEARLGGCPLAGVPNRMAQHAKTAWTDGLDRFGQKQNRKADWKLRVTQHKNARLQHPPKPLVPDMHARGSLRTTQVSAREQSQQFIVVHHVN